MRLALAAGRLDVDTLLGELSGRQLREWEAFERLEGGLGGRAVWQAVAVFIALYAEVHRDHKKRPQPFSARDFLPWIERARIDGPATLRGQFAHLVKKQPRKKR